MADIDRFRSTFAALTGCPSPFDWQEALYKEFVENDVPPACDIPTGLGKTAVIPIWLIALAGYPEKIPRRLVYVVNRRTVVDQTTNEVLKVTDNVAEAGVYDCLSGMCAIALKDEEPPLAVSTLRGQFADNQEWSADPCRPAVICGTVDMIGSRLLFGGYRIGFKSRPLHAGFLGQDVLLVHDEAHLEPAFQKLITDIEKEQEREREGCGDFHWPSLRVMALSATARNGDEQQSQPLGLTEEEKNPPKQVPDPPTKPIHHVWRRLKAKKALSLHLCKDERKQLATQIAERALETHKESGDAVLVFVRKVSDVEKVVKKLTDRKSGVSDDHVEQLTGTMRGLERDKLVRRPTFIRFLPERDRPDDVHPAEGIVYLVCTSAGEVGVNLSADHMVCDLSTFDSMAQRLGRVNRFGDRDDTLVDVVYPESFDDKHPLTPARKATLKLLEVLNGDASLKALDELPMDERLAAFAPTPTILSATDILFDAWAMTSIREKMPGRPPVGPYLHGVADDLPQTTIAWRAELDLIDVNSPDAEKTLQAIFIKHRIRPHETLTTNSYRVSDFLKKLKKRTDLYDTPVAIQFARELRLTTVGNLIDDPGALSAEPTLTLPASFGGLDEGVFSPDAVPKKRPSQDESKSADVNEDASTDDNGRTPTPTLDIADHDGYEAYDGVPTRIRMLIERSEDGWSIHAMPGGNVLPDDWEFESTYEKSAALINEIREQSGLNVRLVQTIETNDEGEAVCSLVCLSPAPPAQQREQHSLADHVALVETEAKRIADALELPEPYRSALLFAAKWHDEGKKADRWQRYIGGPNSNGEPLGKSAKWCDPKLLAGYRHEFGSLVRLENPDVLQTPCTLPEDEDTRDLALHMIATHHGYARPHFDHTVVEGFNSEQEQAAHVELMRRYARLQRKYGRWGLAYLESLLRAADASASRAVGLDPETDDDDLEEGAS